MSQMGPASAQVSRTPNLCDSLAKDLSSRYAVQLLSGAPRRTDRAPDPLVGRFATAVQLYSSLQCPVVPLADMLECLQVAMIEVDGDMRAMIKRRQQCEQQYRTTITGSE
ncbi:MAG: hypothetical protein GY791_16450 [Alphaproteobacteria bacterium]|nr:hypothetical protein [Alphaproteobacteria bacterium]